MVGVLLRLYSSGLTPLQLSLINLLSWRLPDRGKHQEHAPSFFSCRSEILSTTGVNARLLTPSIINSPTTMTTTTTTWRPYIDTRGTDTINNFRFTIWIGNRNPEHRARGTNSTSASSSRGEDKQTLHQPNQTPTFFPAPPLPEVLLSFVQLQCSRHRRHRRHRRRRRRRR